MMMSNEYLDTMQAFFRNHPRLNDWQQQKADETKQSDVYYQAKPLQPKDQARVNQKVDRILDATTVLDQASEQAAQSTEMAVGSVMGLGMLPVVMGLSLGSLFLAENALKKAKNPLLGWSKYLTILGIGLIPTFAIQGFSAIWGAQQETRASRIARRQTRQNELANPNRYALFTEEQKQMAAQKADQIPNDEIEALEKFRNDKTNGFGGGLNQLKTLATDKQSHERDDLLNEVNDRLQKPAQAFSPQSEKDLKEDAALVSNITRTINDRSESYTENVENAYQTLSIGFSTLVALPLSVGIAYLISKTKIAKEGGFLIDLASGVGTFCLLQIPISFIGTALERDGSKVARWKARQDIKNDPNSMLAVPDEDKASVQGIKDENFKPKGIWDSFKQAFTLPFEFMKDHKAYQAWEKTEGIEEKKRRKALDQIQLSPEQLAEAKRLQARTHEGFGLTDEYSQDSEMMEASTDTLKQIAGEIPQLALMAPAAAIVAGHYVPLPRVKWLEKTADAHGITRPLSERKGWEPLLSEWRLDTIGKSFAAYARKKLEEFERNLKQLLEEKSLLKPLKTYGKNLDTDFSKLIEEMGTDPLEKTGDWMKWIKEGSKYKTLRNTGIGVAGTVAVGGLAVLLGPVLLANSVFTRWQKDSMRVGLMQADDAMKHPNFFKLDGEEKQNPQKPAVA
jgi:hypothetical protein